MSCEINHSVMGQGQCSYPRDCCQCCGSGDSSPASALTLASGAVGLPHGSCLSNSLVTTCAVLRRGFSQPIEFRFRPGTQHAVLRLAVHGRSGRRVAAPSGGRAAADGRAVVRQRRLELLRPRPRLHADLRRHFPFDGPGRPPVDVPGLRSRGAPGAILHVFHARRLQRRRARLHGQRPPHRNPRHHSRRAGRLRLRVVPLRLHRRGRWPRQRHRTA